MSRGPGKLQAAVLEILEDTKELATFESLRWSLYHDLGNPSLSPDTKLPTKWNTSLRRAVQVLGEGEYISIQKRPLQSFEECVNHYPGKTLCPVMRFLRSTFLPTLSEWIRDPSGLGPKYGVDSNELFNFQALAEEVREALRALWIRIEDPLRGIYGRRGSSSDELLKLLCKGRSLFRAGRFFGNRFVETGGIVVAGSLSGHIDTVCHAGLVPPDIGAELQLLKNQFLPPQTANTLRFKSLIHEFADVPRHGQCQLRPDTLDYLHKTMEHEVEAMKGFEELKPSRFGFDVPLFKYDPQLTKLFDHTVFQDFSFLSLPQPQN